jgi:hypothetical protein
MRKPAPRQILTGRGRPVDQAEGAERPETLVEGDPETLPELDNRLSPGAL